MNPHIVVIHFSERMSLSVRTAVRSVCICSTDTSDHDASQVEATVAVSASVPVSVAAGVAFCVVEESPPWHCSSGSPRISLPVDTWARSGSQFSTPQPQPPRSRPRVRSLLFGRSIPSDAVASIPRLMVRESIITPLCLETECQCGEYIYCTFLCAGSVNIPFNRKRAMHISKRHGSMTSVQD